MKLPTLSPVLVFAAALLASRTTSVFGQVAPAPVTPAIHDSAVKLDPFQVSADSDVGFVAATSLAGGRISTALKDTPVAYSVITKEFLEAFNVKDVSEAAAFTVNSDNR